MIVVGILDDPSPPLVLPCKIPVLLYEPVTPDTTIKSLVVTLFTTVPDPVDPVCVSVSPAPIVMLPVVLITTVPAVPSISGLIAIRVSPCVEPYPPERNVVATSICTKS